MADYALIVGIERYQTPQAEPLQGPSLDALRFALWLRNAREVPSDNIILIHNKCDAWKDDPVREAEYRRILTEVTALGIKSRGNPSRETIRDAWLKELLTGPEEEGTLWIYWSGHGVTFPQNRDVVLCANEEQGDTSFVYLAEFRDSLRSPSFERFHRQRLIVDACAEYLKPEDLGMRRQRNPETWDVTRSPEQIELSAVAMGRKARVDKGVSLFSGVLFGKLDQSGWPSDLPAFYAALEKAIAAVAPEGELPRLRIMSPRYENGLGTGRNDRECSELREVLAQHCQVSFDRYRPFYLRTMGLATAPEVREACSLTAMIGELLQLGREEEFGGLSRRLVEFLCRVVQDYTVEAAPLAEWLRKKVPPGGLLTVKEQLNQEAPELVLAIVLQETALNSTGFPTSLRASLCDRNLAIRSPWTRPNIADVDALEREAREILQEAGKLAESRKADLMVHVFANPPLLRVPWQAFPLNPDDDDGDVFGQRYSFVLRSRARLEGRDDRYDLNSWRSKSKALRLRACREIEFEPAPPWSGEAKDLLAKVTGLLFIRDTLAAPSMSRSDTDRLLTVALKKGLPLASWRIELPRNTGSPESSDWDAFQADVRKLFDMTASLPETPVHFRDARKSERWARETALFWDDEECAEKLRQMLKEPDQK